MPTEYQILQNLDELLRWRVWRHGYPAPIWFDYSSIVMDFVRKNKLEPVPPEQLFQGGPELGQQEVGAKAAAVRLIPRPFPGGLRFAHLHLKGDVFQLDPAAWQQFSATILDNFRERLGKARSVTFDQMLDLGEAMTTLV